MIECGVKRCWSGHFCLRTKHSAPGWFFAGLSSRDCDSGLSQPRRGQTALRGRPVAAWATTDCDVRRTRRLTPLGSPFGSSNTTPQKPLRSAGSAILDVALDPRRVTTGVGHTPGNRDPGRAFVPDPQPHRRSFASARPAGRIGVSQCDRVCRHRGPAEGPIQRQRGPGIGRSEAFAGSSPRMKASSIAVALFAPVRLAVPSAGPVDRGSRRHGFSPRSGFGFVPHWQ